MAIIYHKDLTGADLHSPKEHANEAHSGAYIETCNKHTKNDHDALALDHGALSGKADDDHDQYYNATRHTKAIHDSLNINADKVDACDAGIATGNVFKLPAGLAHGDIFYVDASGNVLRLGYGTSGHFLKTQGAGANPIWAAGGGGVTDHGALTGLGDDDHSQYYNSARHTKAIHDSLNINAGQVDGCDAGVVANNVFKIPTIVGGDILYVSGTNTLVKLAAGTSGHFLKTQGSGVSPVWAAGAGGVTDHGELTGLNDDDHSQYYNSARHTKTVHDSLNINAGQVDGCDAGVATGNVFKLPVSLTHGDIFYVASGGNVVRLSAGTSGYFLKTQGSGTNPIWTAHTKSVHDALGLDHGALSGRTDDDHSQYYNSARHTKAIHDSLGINAATLESSTKAQVRNHTPASHGADKHTNRTRKVFFPLGQSTTGTVDMHGNHSTILLDADAEAVFGTTIIPEDYVSDLIVYAVLIPLATGNLIVDIFSDWFTTGDSSITNKDDHVDETHAVIMYEFQILNIHVDFVSPDSGNPPEKGEILGIQLKQDTGINFEILGFMLSYIADQ